MRKTSQRHFNKKHFQAQLLIYPALVFSGFFIGINTSKIKSISKIAVNEEFGCQNTSNEQRLNLEDEIKKCINNEATLLSFNTDKFDFSRIGITSSLFTSDTDVEVNNYDYKRTRITSNTFNLNSSTIQVWQMEDSDPILTFPVSKNLEIYNYFPIITEPNNDLLQPSFVSEIAKNWQEDDSFLNVEGIKFYFSYTYGPYTIHSVELQSYWPYSPMGNPIFISIKVPTTDPFIANSSKSALEEFKSMAKSIADTISLKNKYPNPIQ